ncbi:Histone acetyltransferase HPA2 and related acetyltransferases [hydrothermal vent metagenome]|uniref:Histone acetyltransferase HPA2 and related acetyltransferases n=1 Tax=hydrothermal vent metagenome TaxID=652676 RepID=A0A3B0XA83_9ZZZZ
MNVDVIRADYSNKAHEKDIQCLLDAYASDPMGGGKPLHHEVKKNIVRSLAALPHAFSVIAYVEGVAVGLVNCFEAFSTFSCKPLVNVHDVMVMADYRGHRISQKMLEKVEEIAISKGCCKITLEVLSNNEAAKSSYRHFGFSSYELDPAAGHALFWQRPVAGTGRSATDKLQEPDK